MGTIPTSNFLSLASFLHRLISSRVVMIGIDARILLPILEGPASVLILVGALPNTLSVELV